jgi:hypothetical protein
MTKKQRERERQEGEERGFHWFCRSNAFFLNLFSEKEKLRETKTMRF